MHAWSTSAHGLPSGETSASPVAKARAWSLSDRRFYWRWTLIALAMLILPYLLLAALTPRGSLYTGMLFSPNDEFLYLSQMLHSHQGDWGFTDYFSSLRTPSLPVLPLYTLLGKLIPGTDTPLTAALVFHLARLAFALLFMKQAWALYGEALPGRPAGRAAYLLLLFTAGVGVYQTVLDRAGPAPFDLGAVESSSFFGLLHTPHFAATLLLIVIYLRALLAMSRPGAAVWKACAVGSAAMAGVAAIHPEKAVVLALAGGLFLLWRRIFQHRDLRLWLSWGVMVLAAMPYLALLYALSMGPLGAIIGHGRQPTQGNPAYYLLGYGIPGLCALVRVPSLRRRFGEVRAGEMLLWSMVAASLALLAVPGDLVVHKLEGMQVAVAALAGTNLVHTILPALWRSRVFALIVRTQPAGYGRKRLRMLSLNLVLILSTPTVLALAFASPRAGLAASEELFLTADDQAAISWMARHVSRDDVVAGAPESNQFVAAYAGMHVVFAGNWSYALDFDAEAKAFGRLFKDAQETQSYLAERDVRWVYFGPRERHLAAFDPAEVRYLEPVYVHGTLVLYRVKAPVAADVSTGLQAPRLWW